MKIRFVAASVAMAALAAGCAMLGGSKPICWNRTEVIQPKFRGPEGEPVPPAYTESQMRIFAKMIRRSIEDRYMEIQEKRADYSYWNRRKAQWRLKPQIQENANGRISVIIAAYPVDEDRRVDDWTGEFADSKDLLAKKDDFGGKVAEALSGIKLEMPIKTD